MTEEVAKLRAEVERLRLAGQRSPGADDVPARSCQVCYSAGPADLGLECAQGHFTCDECFAGGNLSHQLSAENRASFAAHGARLVCSMCVAPNVHVFTERELANHLDEASMQRYRRAAEEVAALHAINIEKQRHEQELAKLKTEYLQMGSGTPASRVNLHRQHVLESILTDVMYCPRVGCSAPFVDFDGCMALTCSQCSCGFCGWCLADCGRDAHEHVKQCCQAPAKQRGGFYGSMVEFNEVHRGRRQQALERYFAEKVAAEDRAPLQQAVARDMQEKGLQAFDVSAVPMRFRHRHRHRSSSSSSQCGRASCLWTSTIAPRWVSASSPTRCGTWRRAASCAA